jgi:hypothetical protein
MCQYTEATFLFLRGFMGCSKHRAQSPFMLGNSAFDMPSTSEHAFETAIFHFSAVRSLWPTAAETIA